MEEKKSKAKVFWYAVMLTHTNEFNCILKGGTKKELQRNIQLLESTNQDDGHPPLTIAEIIKGKTMPFKTVSKIEF